MLPKFLQKPPSLQPLSDEAYLPLMRREIEWKDKTEDGIKRTVRVTVAQSRVKWQFQLKGEDWDYDTPPSVDDWEMLLEKMEGRYARKRAPLKDLEVVRSEHKKATS